MSNPYLGEIRIFAGNYAPMNWALCNGQLLAIASNTALFSLLGVTYGGDGRSTFALPDLQGGIPIHFGQGAGLSPYQLGQSGGDTTATLTTAEVATHNHIYNCGAGGRGEVTTVAGNVNSDAPFQTNIYAAAADRTTMSPTMLAPSPPSMPHENMQPYLALSFIIALVGIYPPRS